MRSVRLFAAKALGDLGDEQAIPALFEATKDPDKDVRAVAVKALEKLQPHE